MKSVFITHRLPQIAQALLSEHFSVTVREKNEPLSNDELVHAVGTYDAILSAISDRFTRDVLAQKKNLSVISNYAVGLDNIDLAGAKAFGIAIYNTPDVVTASTADLTFALLLSFIRRIEAARRFVREDKWREWVPELLLGEELSGKTFGIIGFGRIGKAVGKRAEGFGLRVIHCSDAGGLPAVLASSDYISIHAPLKTETKHMINAEAFSQMKRKPILINMARGAIVETGALLDALRSGQVRGACLDVVDPEPLHGDHPLLDMEQCLIVPHIGTATVECRENMAKLAAENIINHFLYEERDKRKTL